MNTLAAHALGDVGRKRFDPAGDRAAAVFGQADRYRFLLLLRFLLINATGSSMLGARSGCRAGSPGSSPRTTPTFCKLIFGLFLVGLVWTGQHVGMLSRELNALEQGPAAGRAVPSFMREIAGRDGLTRAGTDRRRCASSWRTGSRRSGTSPARSSCWA